ncbi:hypothetical protein KAU11_04270 [Candidatus Babeliales bacterium]|nr:hypothetical protein [Candidatus Babeliales bacterium]
MKVSIITTFPQLYDAFLSTSLIKIAQQNNLVEFSLVELSSLCQPGKRIDESTVGPGPGMILKPKIIGKAIEKCISTHGPGFKIFFSPQGTKLSQPLLRSMASHISVATANTPSTSETELLQEHIILVCARYEGIDARVEAKYADLVLSIGDYVLMGGDLPAQVFIEGFLRLLPGVLGSEESAKTESFESPFFDHPEYGLPTTWHEQTIPPIVQSGNHKAISEWRKNEAAQKTILNRFDWFRSQQPSAKDQAIAKKYIPPHYVVLMHDQVVVRNANASTTSVTSLDLHDIARACATYDIKNFFVVTPLKDQQSIVKEFINFWTNEHGKKYNPSRFTAVSRLILCSSLDDVMDKINEQEGKTPFLVTTSAKKHNHEKYIDYNDQALVWESQKPVLILIGTGQGLQDQLIEKSNFLLLPIDGMSNYNHLSVRAATGIILDRWLGLQHTITRSPFKGSRK